MRYLRIFLLHFQEVFQERSRIIIWLLGNIFPPLILILFWRGAASIKGWTLPQITSYYLLVIIMSAFLMAHHENAIARIDIREGYLTALLLKPFSYFWLKFFSEVSSRVLQGLFGVIFLLVFIHFFPALFVFTDSFVVFLLSLLIAVLAFFLAFTFKTIIGISAFWMTDTHGLFETAEIVLFIISGTLMPIAFFPQWLMYLASVLPFSYIIYFPILAFEGKLAIPELLQVLGVQLVWLLVFAFFYRIFWRAGIKKYTAVGQ